MKGRLVLWFPLIVVAVTGAVAQVLGAQGKVEATIQGFTNPRLLPLHMSLQPPVWWKAEAVIQGFTNPQIQGTLTFTQASDMTVHITGEIRGLPPNKTLALHVHRWGDCREPKASGGHFDPYRSGKHGHPNDPVGTHHSGDLPNIQTDAKGVARVHFTTKALTVEPSPTSVLGRAVIIHEGADDYQSQPAGAAGGRIACGIIGVVQEP